MPEKRLGRIWSAALALLAGVLALRAGAGFESHQGMKRALAAGQADVERCAGEQRRLKAELDALDHDPMYLEQMLRRNRRIGPDEETRPR